MDTADILSRIDHTQLAPTAGWAAIEKLCREAVEFRTASVCVPPSYVGRIRAAFPDLVICTVIGFPLGYSVTEAKTAEVGRALADGASEFDMVIDIGAAKAGDFDRVARDIAAVRAAAGDLVLKVIIETCYLDEAEKIRLCGIVTETGADFIKTSTGFGPAGATLADIELFRAHIGPAVKMKAAGGISSRADLEAFIAAGCARIGTSRAVSLLAGGGAGSGY